MKIWVPRTFYGKAAAVEGWGCIFTLNPSSRLRGRCMLAGFPQGPLHALGVSSVSGSPYCFSVSLLRSSTALERLLPALSARSLCSQPKPAVSLRK